MISNAVLSLILVLTLSLINASPHPKGKAPHHPHGANTEQHHPHGANKEQHHPHVVHKGPHHGNDHSCPAVCRCHKEQLDSHHGQFGGHHGTHPNGRFVVNCSGSFANLTLPSNFPTRVHTLILDDNHFTELKFDFINTSMDLSGLKILSICGSSVEKIDEQAFVRMTGLVELRLNFNRINFLPPRLFEHNARLQILSITNNPLNMSSVGTDFLKFLPNLNVLDLSHLDEELVQLPESFASLTNLTELHLRGAVFPNISAHFFSPFAEIDLLKLDLSQTRIKNVDPDAFKPLSQLTELILGEASVTTQNVEEIINGLSNSSIKILNLDDVFSNSGHNHSVNKHLFHPLNNTKLKVLYFRGNHAGLHGKLPAKLFQSLKVLRDLYVDNCGLVSVSVDAFHGLHHLHTLSMTRNSLTCATENDCPFLSGGVTLKLLQKIDLSDNHITDSGFYSFADNIFPNLTNLSLTNNKLRSIPVGMFGSLPKLSELDLSSNPIEEISTNAFTGLSTLAKLHIENCPKLNRIKEGTFTGLDRLELLSLRNSGVVHIHHAALSHLNRLEWLYLENNRLGESGTAIERVTLRKSILKMLDISENQLRSLPMGLLHNSHSLAWLTVNKNRLFNCSQFHVLFGSKLTNLDASYNQFAQPSISCFEGMDKLVNLNLAGNPFVCSCELKSFTEWLTGKKISTEQTSEYVCVAPDNNIGKNVFAVSYSNWVCYGKTTTLTSVLVVTFIAIVVCLGFIGARRFKRARSNGCRMSSNCESNSGEGNRGLKVSSATDSCLPYCPLDEDEGSPVMQNTTIGRGFDCNAENHGGNGVLFSPDRLDTNGKVVKNGKKKKVPTATLR